MKPAEPAAFNRLSTHRASTHCVREVVAGGAVVAAASLVAAVLLWIVFDVAAGGLSQLDWSYLVDDVADAGRGGGIGPVILSTGLIVGVALVVAVPMALATAAALTEPAVRTRPFAGCVRLSVDVLAGVPSIVFGLFGNAFFAITLGLGYSILTGGLTLACMILPILIRAFEQAIVAVPNEYQLAAASLGLGRAAILFRVTLPVALPALAAGVVLGIGRALAETAALIFTSGYVTRTPQSLLDSGRSLSVHIYDLAMNVAGGSDRAYAAACVLIGFLLAINGLIAVLTGWSRKRLEGVRPA